MTETETEEAPPREVDCRPDERYPSIGDYALLSDRHTAALVSRAGSIDWCCLPRFDSSSTFGRLLDWERGGHCAISPATEAKTSRRYVDDTLVLETRFRSAEGEARVLDCLLLSSNHDRTSHRRLLRVVEGVRGEIPLDVVVCPRFDYGDLAPWFRCRDDGQWVATGGDDGLLVWSDFPLTPVDGDESLHAHVICRAGDRYRLAMRFTRPEEIGTPPTAAPEPSKLDRDLEETIRRWSEWSGSLELPPGRPDGAQRSALAIRGLVYEPTGAIAAAATTSLPEAPAGTRNWDYRYAWLRDSVLSSRALAAVGVRATSDGFRRFVERSAVGRAEDLRVLYAVGGERRLGEQDAPDLEGYRGARPVRVGNLAAAQLQLDAYGHLLMQSWNWHSRGESPDGIYWGFLVRLVEFVVEHWRKPDAGLWEWRGAPRHFVHSKAMCWAAIECGRRLARDLGEEVPEERWRRTAEDIRAAVLDEGVDDDRGCFVQALGEPHLDAATLRLPVTEIVAWDDERMIATADAVARDLDAGGGLVRRYVVDDGTGEPREGAFLPCCFWLAELLARQGRLAEARERFDAAAGTANDLGFFSEEHDPSTGEMLGNYPQALTHLAHLDAARALDDAA